MIVSLLALEPWLLITPQFRCDLINFVDLVGFYITPGRLSCWCELTPVPSHGSTFVYMIPPQNVMLA